MTVQFMKRIVRSSGCPVVRVRVGTKPGLWILDWTTDWTMHWTMDWTVDWIMDSILDLILD